MKTKQKGGNGTVEGIMAWLFHKDNIPGTFLHGCTKASSNPSLFPKEDTLSLCASCCWFQLYFQLFIYFSFNSEEDSLSSFTKSLLQLGTRVLLQCAREVLLSKKEVDSPGITWWVLKAQQASPQFFYMTYENTKEHLAVVKLRCQAHFSPKMLFQNDQAYNSFFPQAGEEDCDCKD